MKRPRKPPDLSVFANLQRLYTSSQDAALSYRNDLERKYGPGGVCYRNASESRVLARLDKGVDKYYHAIYAWLDKYSPLCWQEGVPVDWTCRHLKPEDAISEEPSEVPPAAWGMARGRIPRHK